MKKIWQAIAFVPFLAWAGSSYATVFDFDVTFDGVNATVDGSSDPVAGTNLLPGDSYSLDIHATANDFWSVNSNVSLGIYASFFVLDSGLRTGNVTTTFFLDGGQVAQDIDLGVNQGNVHMGGQSFNLAAGTLFDQVVVSYDFLATASTFTTIQPDSNIISWFPFFRNSSISYVQGTVPEPTTLLLLALGLAGLGFARKRLR